MLLTTYTYCMAISYFPVFLRPQQYFVALWFSRGDKDVSYGAQGTRTLVRERVGWSIKTVFHMPSPSLATACHWALSTRHSRIALQDSFMFRLLVISSNASDAIGPVLEDLQSRSIYSECQFLSQSFVEPEFPTLLRRGKSAWDWSLHQINSQEVPMGPGLWGRVFLHVACRVG